MKYNLKNLSRAGFKSSALFATQTGITILYRVKPGRVEYANGYDESIGVFKLSRAQMRAFNAGKLALVPPGHCSPVPGEKLATPQVISTQPVRNLAELEQLFQSV